MDITDILKKNDLLSTFSEQIKKKFVKYSEQKKYSSGETIISEGDSTTDLYIIIRGQAKAITKRQDGSEISLNRFGPGDYFGEMSFLD